MPILVAATFLVPLRQRTGCWLTNSSVRERLPAHRRRLGIRRRCGKHGCLRPPLRLVFRWTNSVAGPLVSGLRIPLNLARDSADTQTGINSHRVRRQGPGRCSAPNGCCVKKKLTSPSGLASESEVILLLAHFARWAHGCSSIGGCPSPAIAPDCAAVGLTVRYLLMSCTTEMMQSPKFASS